MPASNAHAFAPITYAVLSTKPIEPIPWLWEPFIPAGRLVALAAGVKVGKSTLAYDIAVAVAQGRPMLGYPTQRAPVLILSLEEHERDVRP